MKAKIDVYQIITDRIIALLESGVCPWKKPWKGGEAGMPRNLVSGKAYRGCNVWLLASLGFESPLFVTFKQAKAKGGKVKKGEKGFPVIFWNFVDSKTEFLANGKPKKIGFLRYYTVFNVCQCEGIDYEKPVEDESPDFSPIEVCESVVENMPNKPEIKFNESRAYYQPACDFVNMPKPETFNSPEAFYSTEFHELAHSTGHKSRIGRPGIEDFDRFGSHQYSKEELVAEMSAAFLCGHCGIDSTVENSAAYLQSWVKKLKEEKKWIVWAGGQAQKAADFILGIESPEKVKA